MLAPVILFVYNREEHTAATLEALKRNRLAAESELYVFSDGAKSDNEIERVENVRKLLHRYQLESNFKRIEIVEAKQNQGLSASVIAGVTKIISKYGKVIVLEDDILTSPDFLAYMNKALDFYENNAKIWSISAYTLELKKLKHYDYPVYFGYRASSWGWATWKDRWELNDWDMKDYAQFVQDAERCRKFNRGGEDMCRMLAKQMEGKIDSWAIRWCYHQSKNDMLTVFPTVSYVKNTGCDGSGVHSGKSHVFDTVLKDASRAEPEFIDTPFLVPGIVREFHDIYSGTFRIRIRNKIRTVKGKLKRKI